MKQLTTMAYTPAWKIAQFEQEKLRELRTTMRRHDHLVAVAISCKFRRLGCTFDDDITGKRWVFDKLGELIKVRSRSHIYYSQHEWQPGLRDRIDIA